MAEGKLGGVVMIVIVVIGAYLLGSIPVAWLVCKWITGEDLRCLGSGNVGVMNTALSAARWGGLLVFLAEIGKGVLAVIIPRALVSGELMDIAVGLSIIAVVVGTRWPVWLRFQGGRGNTAGISALTLISWQTGALLLCTWFLLRLLVRSSFLTTRITLFLLPVPIWIGTRSWWYALVGLALGLIYLSTQYQKSDDHLLLKEDWPSFWAFLTSPPRKRQGSR
jgi:glycerol-3-phosphate acyltransferase PlsY